MIGWDSCMVLKLNSNQPPFTIEIYISQLIKGSTAHKKIDPCNLNENWEMTELTINY